MIKVKDNLLVFTGYQFRRLGDDYLKVEKDNENYIRKLTDAGCVVDCMTLKDGSLYYTIILNRKGVLLAINYVNGSGQRITLMSDLQKSVKEKMNQYPDFMNWCKRLIGWNLDLNMLVTDYIETKGNSSGIATKKMISLAYKNLSVMCN
jgi:hypothetical protein